MILETIRKLCDGKKISIHELEMSCGIGNGTLARWDKVSPTLPSLKKVADYFGCNISDLLKEGTK